MARFGHITSQNLRGRNASVRAGRRRRFHGGAPPLHIILRKSTCIESIDFKALCGDISCSNALQTSSTCTDAINFKVLCGKSLSRYLPKSGGNACVRAGRRRRFHGGAPPLHTLDYANFFKRQLEWRQLTPWCYVAKFAGLRNFLQKMTCMQSIKFEALCGKIWSRYVP